MTDPRRRAVHAAALGIAGCLVLVGCGGSTNAAGTSTQAGNADATSTGSIAPTGSASPDPTTSVAAAAQGGDACTLVTEQEASTALGTDPGPGSPFTSHGATQCQYGTYQKGFVLVNVTPSQGKAAYDLMRTNPKLSEAGVVSDVAGLGDRAFEIAGPHTASIYFGKGDALILVSVVTPAEAASPKGQALVLAHTAADRV